MASTPCHQSFDLSFCPVLRGTAPPATPTARAATATPHSRTTCLPSGRPPPPHLPPCRPTAAFPPAPNTRLPLPFHLPRASATSTAPPTLLPWGGALGDRQWVTLCMYACQRRLPACLLDSNSRSSEVAGFPPPPPAEPHGRISGGAALFAMHAEAGRQRGRTGQACITAPHHLSQAFPHASHMPLICENAMLLFFSAT